MIDQKKLIASAVSCAAAFSTASANGGPAIVARTISDIQVDGDLSDWPQSARRQQLWHFDFEVSSRPAEDDASGGVMVGFDREERALYVALDIKDDIIITDRMTNRLPNGLGTNPDGVLLYMDLEHRDTFAEKMEFSYVSRAIAAADNALLPDGIVTQARRITDTGMTAEWRIDLPALLAQQGLDPMRGDGRDLVVGFDAVYFDRDGEDDGSIIKWTVGPNDGQENRDMGDLFVLSDDRELVRVEGSTSWSENTTRPPHFAHFISRDDPSFVVRGTTHPDGVYHIKVPSGRYEAKAGDSRSFLTDAKPRSIRIRDKNRTIRRPLEAELPNRPLDELVPAMMQKHGVRTVGVAWIKSDEVVVNETFGVDANGNTATADTRFRVASITKPISTMTLLSLSKSGDWDLDAPLADHWIDPDIANDERHLLLTTTLALRHLTGLPNWRGRAALSFLYDPGTRQSYSGEGFQYAMRALEAATGRDLEELARERVFRPANMPHTSYRWSDAHEDLFAGEYFGTGAQVPHYRGDRINAAANLLSTPTDLVNFARWVMELRKKEPELFAKIEQANGANLIDPNKPEMSRHGLGWLVHKGDGVTILEHSGGQRGIRTHLIIAPERDEALVVLTNSSAGWPLIRSVFEATLNRDGALSNTAAQLYGEIKF